jgi:hypothetical protein
MNAPPWIQTITGRRSRAGAPAGAAVHTLSVRQSSLVFAAHSPPGTRCGHAGPAAVAARSPAHGATGCGGRQRRSPTGGVANGTPRNTRTPAAESSRPTSVPASTVTRGPSAGM